MRTIFKALIIFTIIFMFGACTSIDSEEDLEEVNEYIIPNEIQRIIDKVENLAKKYALQLDGEWADEYVNCLDSEEAREYKGYSNLKATLDQFRIECGADRIYVLTDINAGDEYFELTIDSSKQPDEWMGKYKIEDHYISAQKGVPQPSDFAKKNNEGLLIWSASAPVYDSSGYVVGILNIDYPIPEIEAYPELIIE
ncbi:MAG: hypothetical protein GX363_07675 [Clostridiales bacterium]|jgi:hypothetical protein|nr:hypothetical protein [Clostridiales bacterium]